MQAENDKTERVTGLGRRTREEIAKWNQMTALRFQTGEFLVLKLICLVLSLLVFYFSLFTVKVIVVFLPFACGVILFFLFL